MAKTPKEYQRLSGRGMRMDGSRWFAYSRLLCSIWMGADHLLLVDQIGYNETYKRFYFRDIQAVIIRRTTRARTANLIMGLLFALCSCWALAIANLGGRVFLWTVAGFFALLVLINLLRGPSCVAQIKTPVQLEEVPSWNRLSKARRGLDKIRPRIIEAQGAFAADELKGQLEERLRRISDVPPAERT